MFDAQNQAHPLAAAQAQPDVRAEFIRKTYAHLVGAILAFVGIEFIIFNTVDVPALAGRMTGGFSWLIVLGLFMVVSWIADRWARSTTSIGTQYMGLGLYVVAIAVLFVPLLYVADYYAPGGELISQAAVVTLLLTAGLTATVFITRKDFSFLGPIIGVGCFIALGVIIAGIAFGFSLGLFFSAAMVVLMAGSILYTTSNILHHYSPGQHVAASLSLFAAVAMLFWYVLRIGIALAGDD